MNPLVGTGTLYHKIFVCKYEFNIFEFCMSLCWIFAHKGGVVGLNSSSRVVLKYTCSLRSEILITLQKMTSLLRCDAAYTGK